MICTPLDLAKLRPRIESRYDYWQETARQNRSIHAHSFGS